MGEYLGHAENVRFRPWNARLCMSEVFPRHSLIKNTISKVIGFLIKICWRKIWDMQNVRFRAWNAHLCMSQVFPTIFWFKKAKLYNLVFFLNQNMMENSWDMHKRAFQGLKRTFMHVSNLTLPYFDLKKPIYKVIGFYQNYGGGRPETRINMRFRPWNPRLWMPQVFPYHVLI